MLNCTTPPSSLYLISHVSNRIKEITRADCTFSILRRNELAPPNSYSHKFSRNLAVLWKNRLSCDGHRRLNHCWWRWKGQRRIQTRAKTYKRLKFNSISQLSQICFVSLWLAVGKESNFYPRQSKALLFNIQYLVNVQTYWMKLNQKRGFFAASGRLVRASKRVKTLRYVIYRWEG